MVSKTWNAFYGTWLPRRGYEPDDKPALEIYLNSPHDTPPEKLLTELLIPVRPINNTGMKEK